MATPLPNRKTFAARGLVALSLADIQKPGAKLAYRICKRHRWTISKYNRRCQRCGVEEEK